MRGGTLRPTRTSSSMLPSRQTISQNRDCVRDALRSRELLLALHVRLRTSQHDPLVR